VTDLAGPFSRYRVTTGSPRMELYCMELGKLLAQQAHAEEVSSNSYVGRLERMRIEMLRMRMRKEIRRRARN